MPTDAPAPAEGWPETVETVQRTFARVAERREEAAALFYEVLFELDAGTRPLFARTDMRRQGELLLGVLGTAVAGLSGLEELKPTLRELGRRHVGYGVEPRHYDAVGRALVETVRRLVGDAFTPEVRRAWVRVYRELSAVMIEGAGPES